MRSRFARNIMAAYLWIGPLILLNAADLAITLCALRMGHEEANPFVGSGIESTPFILMKLGWVPVLIVYAAFLLTEGSYRILVKALTLLMGAVVAYNIGVMVTQCSPLDAIAGNRVHWMLAAAGAGVVALGLAWAHEHIGRRRKGA